MLRGKLLVIAIMGAVHAVLPPRVSPASYFSLAAILFTTFSLEPRYFLRETFWSSLSLGKEVMDALRCRDVGMLGPGPEREEPDPEGEGPDPEGEGPG